MNLARLKAFKHKTLLAAFLVAGALITWGGFHNELKPHETRAQSSPYQCPATQAVTGQYSNTGQTCGWVYPSAAPAGDLGGTWLVQLVTGINGLAVPVSTPYVGTNANGQLISATPPSAGPTGPTGATGATGPTGSTGATGASGASAGTTVNAAGAAIVPKCYKGFVTSTSAGLWSVSYASLGTTLIYVNASALSTSNATGTGINSANVSAASLTAASGNVMTQSPLTILTINLFSPVLQTTPTTIWVEACAV